MAASLVVGVIHPGIYGPTAAAAERHCFIASSRREEVVAVRCVIALSGPGMNHPDYLKDLPQEITKDLSIF